MEEPCSIKQEKVDHFATEPNVNFETNVLDLMEIKLEPIKVERVEPHLNVHEPNNFDQKCILTEEAKMIGTNDDKPGKILQQYGSQIKLEEIEEMGDIEKMGDTVGIKWEIKNDELNIKEEENNEADEQGNKQNMVMDIPKRAGRLKKTTFTVQQTTDFVKYLTECDSRGLKLTLIQVRKLAFQFAEENAIDHGFSRKTKTAGVGWWRTFSAANNLSFRNSVVASFVPHNQVAVRFFKILRDVKRKFRFKPGRIYNAGEINLCLISTDEQVERNRKTTLVCAVNAVGSYVPPFFVFALHRMKPGLLNGCPSGSVGIAQPSGWTTAKSFLAYLKHFAKYAKPSIDDPVLLLVDSRSSHISLLVLNFCSDNGIILIDFPARTKLWKAFFRPLEAYYHSETVTCDRTLLPLLAKAYCEAAENNAVRGFNASGIEPFNPIIVGISRFKAVETKKNKTGKKSIREQDDKLKKENLNKNQ